ncbi:MAG: FadR family transcriptional regulator [Armatimonadetes bacterium]|nr:FadR family transcriptional regulator [Armatimonadota bacterium]
MSDHRTNPDPVRQPVRRTKIYEEVAARILRLISEGRLEPGDKLPPERELAAALGVSRTSIRDAIRTLEATGLLEPRQGHGTVIRELSAAGLVAPIASALGMRPDLVPDVMAFRKMIEPTLARQAAVSATPDEVRQLEAILVDQTVRVEAGGLGVEEGGAFHGLIARAARNQVAGVVVELLLHLLRSDRELALRARGRPRQSLRGHRAILEAIRRRDGGTAEQAMLAHLEQIEATLLPVRARAPARTEGGV